MTQPLAVNGLLMPPDFPTAAFEHGYVRFGARHPHADSYRHFVGAWNAVSLRFLAMVDEGDAFTTAVSAPDAHATVTQRYSQERHLFGLYGSGFSIFEAYFYGMFAVGAALLPGAFPMVTPREQQSISPGSAVRAFEAVFAGDAILDAFRAVMADTAYREWKEVRNVLTHRTAPGRTIFVSIGSDEELAPVWQLSNIPLDHRLAEQRRSEASRMLATLLVAAAQFIESRML